MSVGGIGHLIVRALRAIGSALVALLGAIMQTISEILSREVKPLSNEDPFADQDEAEGYGYRMTHPPDEPSD